MLLLKKIRESIIFEILRDEMPNTHFTLDSVYQKILQFYIEVANIK